MDTASGNDRARIALLLDCYGKMLTEKQYAAMDLYFQEDFTLSEIAEQTGITRQGVWDNIKRGEKLLTEMESKLRLVERFSQIKEKISQANDAALVVKDYAAQKYLPAPIIRNLDRMMEIFQELSEY